MVNTWYSYNKGIGGRSSTYNEGISTKTRRSNKQVKSMQMDTWIVAGVCCTYKLDIV